MQTTAEEVLVDFVVRDRRGRQVADLRPEEMEVLEDGVPQQIRSLRRIEGGDVIESAPRLGERPQRLDLTRQVRLILLAFDRLSANGRALVRRAVEDLMKRGIPPNTYYAVVQLDPSFRTVQPFTNEPYLVKWAVERLTGARGARGEGVPQIGQPTKEMRSGDPAAAAVADALAEMEARAAEMERERQGTATVQGLLSMVLGLRRIEGRKTAVFFSEGLAGGPLLQALVGQANRNNVAFYTVDARGLRPAAALAGDDPSQPPVLEAGSAPALEALAAATGGVAAAGTNDLRAPLRQAVEDAAAYFLLS